MKLNILFDAIVEEQKRSIQFFHSVSSTKMERLFAESVEKNKKKNPVMSIVHQKTDDS